MPCSRKQITKLFFNITSILKFFFVYFYLFALFFAKLFTYVFRSADKYDDGLLYDEEEEEEEYDQEGVEVEEREEESRYSHDETNNYLLVDIVNNGESLIFMPEKTNETENNNLEDEQNSSSYESTFEDPIENFDDPPFYVEDCTTSSDFEHDNCDDFADNEVIKEVYTTSSLSNLVEERFEQTLKPKNDVHDYDQDGNDSEHFRSTSCQSNAEETIHQKTTITIGLDEYGSEMNFEDYKGGKDERKNEIVEDTEFTRDGKFLIFDPPKSETKKLQVMEKQRYETFEDTYTIGSTSKSSSDWRSSIPDSCTEDPFSSSSRRSCPKWESYTVYQKYDEEMIFLDRISAQKLHETESLRSFQVEPRSISQRIVHKLGNNKQKSSEQVYKKTYYQLEAAYVAQICLAWEALNWNYTNFQRKLVSMKVEDRGCPAYIGQQFQQLQVLLQRFIENEPYERGRRPEIYARMRGGAPKLLQVPEYHDYEGEDNEEASNARIPSASFLSILEEAIRTYMNFLKADRKTHCQVFALFKRRPKVSVDLATLHSLKSHCKKKKLKLRELQRTCILFRRKLENDEEMEILMALIDLEVVTRVLRMTEITQQQLKWCEDKMNKVRLFEGKLQRDSSPLFFPPHSHDTTTMLVDSP